MGRALPVVAVTVRSSCGTDKQENYFTLSQDIQMKFAALLLVLIGKPLSVVPMTQSNCGTCKQESSSTPSADIQREFTVLLLARMGMSWPVAAMIARSSCGTCKQE